MPDRCAVVITCEHGGNRIPSPYRSLFAGQETLLASHRGFDAGALELARDLADALAAPLVASTVCRLLVDLNRSVGNPVIHSEVIRHLPAEQRAAILARFYQPYRSEAESVVRQAIAARGRVLHLSSHSFTPVLDGRQRRADVGLLYDPRRPGEVARCAHWKAALAHLAPHLQVRRNYPYAGKGDGLTAWFRRRLPAEAYVGIELEVNQKHQADGGAHWATLRRTLIESLREALLRSTGSPPAPPLPQELP